MCRNNHHAVIVPYNYVSGKYSYVPAPRSIFKDLSKLPQASLIRFESGDSAGAKPLPELYWNLADEILAARREPHIGSYDEAIETCGSLFEQSVARRRAVTRETDSLDELAAADGIGGPVTMRWLLVHMIEEYARHCGHADLLREMIDGATGD